MQVARFLSVVGGPANRDRIGIQVHELIKNEGGCPLLPTKVVVHFQIPWSSIPLTLQGWCGAVVVLGWESGGGMGTAHPRT